MNESPEYPNEIIIDETRHVFVKNDKGCFVQIALKQPVACIMLHHEHHNPQTVITMAYKKNAIYEGKFIIVMGDGNPNTYTETELRQLLHP